MMCLDSFFAGPGTFFLGSFIASFLSIFPFFKAQTTKQRIFWAQLHLFFLIFPFVFYFFFKTCETFFFSCAQTEKLFFIGVLSFFVVGSVLVYALPRIYIHHLLKKAFVAHDVFAVFLKKRSSVQPALYYLDTAQPVAFSVSFKKPCVVLSVGLCELLSKKEKEAVLLHELYHIAQQHSSLKMTLWIAKWMSPIAAFSSWNSVLQKEEQLADNAVFTAQKTRVNLLRAKSKIRQYEKLI